MNNSVRLILTVLLLSCFTATWAQTHSRHVVVDGDTGRGIANVSIMGRDFTAVTDSAGGFTLTKECRTLLLSHINYVSYLVNLNDLGDTVALYSNSLHLNEVVVRGTPREDPLAELNSRLRLDKTEVQLMTANPNGNLFGLLKYLVPKKWRTSKKQRRKEQLKKILEDY